MQESRVTPKAINRSKITLDLTQIQSLPPQPPRSRPTPQKPPTPVPPPPPRPTPPPQPHPQPQPPKPLPKPSIAPKAEQNEYAKGKARPSPIVADANQSRRKSERNASKKVIVMKMTPRHKKEPPKEQRKKKVTQKPRKKTPPKKIRAQKRKPKRPKTLRKAPAPRKTPPKKPSRRRASRPTPKGPDSRLISSLYGSSYSRMSSSQRRFIDENLRQIIRISQRTLNYLGYPQEAAHFGEQGTNVVEFWLHPNGDISGLRLRRRLRSSSLNRQTLEVIKTAYMHYPRPRVRTKIIIYVRYRLH